MSQKNINWQSIIFSPAWLNNLDRLTAKRFGEGGLAEEASTYVLESLSENNWRALSDFKGKSKPETYLYTIKLNYIEEFSRKRFGRPRPPEWLKKQGEFWITVWRLICLEKQIAQGVIDRLSELRDVLYIKDVVRTIKARLPWCGENPKEIPEKNLEEENDDGFEAEHLVDDNVPEKILAQAHHAELLLMLNYLLNSFEDNDTDYEKIPNSPTRNIVNNYSQFSEKFELFSQLLELNSEEKLILRMIYQDGFKKTVVAKVLSMPSHLPGRILKRAFSKIESAMENAGFTIDDIVFESTLD